MDPNRLTQKSQEALHDAQTKALRYGHTQIEPEHLLLALMEQPEGLVPRLLELLDVDARSLHDAVVRYLEGRPSVSGSGASGEVYISRALSQALDRAEQHAQRLRDEYVSVEHLLLAMVGCRRQDPARAQRHARAAAGGADGGAGQPARHQRNA
jgi:ATP-dependent Clp protease ATP-binding subunit ClpB